MSRHGRKLEHVSRLVKVLVDVCDIDDHGSCGATFPLEVVLEQSCQLRVTVGNDVDARLVFV